MEQWYSLVRNFRDESEKPNLTENFCKRVFHDIEKIRLRDKAKFKQRVGPEFEAWAASLAEDYPIALSKEILNDDEFWILTLKLARGI